jgi:Phage major capsid protein E
MAGAQLWQLEEFQPPVILDFVRGLKPPPSYQGETWLPRDTIDDVAFEYFKGVNNLPVMAHIIGWDSEAPMAGRPALGARVTGELPPIKRKQRMSEKEIVRRYMNPRRGTADQKIAIRNVYDDMARLVASIQARDEWLRMQAISENTLIYNEGGVIMEFNYGISDLFQITLAAAAGDATNGADDPEPTFGPHWSDHANATPITDLMTLCKRVEDATGERPTRAVASQEAIDHLLLSEQIKGWTYQQNAPDRPMTPDEVAGTLRRYGVPIPTPYDVRVASENADGTTTNVRTMRNNVVVLQPAQGVGRMLFGPTAEAQLALSGTQYAEQAPGIWANTYATDEPPAQWSKACAVAFPSMPNVDKLAQLTVLPAA